MNNGRLALFIVLAIMAAAMPITILDSALFGGIPQKYGPATAIEVMVFAIGIGVGYMLKDSFGGYEKWSR